MVVVFGQKYKNTESKTDLVSCPGGEAGMRVLHCYRLDRSNCLKSTPLKPYEPLSIGSCAFRKNEHLHILDGVEQLICNNFKYYLWPVAARIGSFYNILKSKPATLVAATINKDCVTKPLHGRHTRGPGSCQRYQTLTGDVTKYEIQDVSR